MCTEYFIFFAVALVFCVLISARVLYLILIERNRPREKSRPIKLMIILGSGGHTAEMLRIVKHLNFKNYSPRVYIHAQTDKLSAVKVKELEGGNKDYKIVEIYRSREVRQSYVTSIWTTILATLNCLPIVWRESPQLILCNGPGTCVPLCIVAFLLKLLCLTQNVIVFIESFCRKMTHSTSVITVPWESLVNELKSIPIEIRVHLASIINVLQTTSEQLTSEKWINTSITRVEACLDRTWEALNSGYWKDVPIEYRYCYTLCVVVKAVLLELQYTYEVNTAGISNDEERKKTLFKNIINQIDKGILLGAPLLGVPNLLTDIATKLNNYFAGESDSVNLQEIDSNKIDDVILPGFSEIVRYEVPSMESFYRDIFMSKCPAILTGCMKHWKALTLWKNSDYLHKIAGSRTVPIEIGSRYTEEDWTQHLVNFSEFLQKHVITSGSQVGYLAQHQLFDQIPELKEDFSIPEYCSFSDSQDDDAEPPDINAWFGPGGTVSPLHFDPKNNLLSQIFGYKRIILYHPDETDKLYPYSTRLLSNTAQVDPINPDYDKWPNFCKTKGIMCHLKPGEMLYIPPKWWHHVTALTPSFSISFWWN